MVACLVLAFAGIAPAAVDGVDVDALRGVAVLDRGRVKPLDTLARETVRSITGKESFGVVRKDADGQHVDVRLDPLAMLLDWQRAPDRWDALPLLYVPNIELRKKVGLAPAEQWIAPETLRADTIFLQWATGLMQRQQAAEQTRELARLSPVEEAGVLLRHRLAAFDSASSGALVCVAPRANDPARGWDDLETLAHADSDPARAVTAAWRDVLDRYASADQSGFDRAAATLDKAVAPAIASANLDARAVALEVSYNRWRPFRVVWVSYFLAVSLFVASALSRRPAVYGVAMGAFIVCIIGHIAAFTLRCRITGWAPVTNMYETVVWVSLVAAVIALVIELVTRSRSMAVAGATTALIASIVADVMPPEMGRQIGTLAPVLRSNYWLTIHVLTIVSSYAAFALACVLGNIGLARFAFPRSTPTARETTARGVKLTYRAVQVGVLLIAAGTILGGLWADVSWGRFWGWDPKEVWALIVLLTYLALLHGRFAGRLGPFGFTAGAVVCFTSVLMSWYGVNFVLGAGLHSYGFGSGGQGYVASYVVVQLAWVVVARVLQRRTLRAATVDQVAQRPRVVNDPSTSGLVPQLDRSAGA